jgi:predicted MFS family arabinose efflux permease
MSSNMDAEKLKTVWPFGKFGRGYDLNRKQYWYYAYTVRFMQIFLFLMLILNISLAEYLYEHFGWPRTTPLWVASAVVLLCYGAIHLITAAAPISQLAKSSPSYGKDPAILSSLNKMRTLLGILCGSILVFMSALALMGEIMAEHKIEPSVLGIFLFSLALIVFFIRHKKRQKR